MMIRNGKLPHSLTYYSHRALQTSGQEHNSSIILTVLSVLICLLACLLACKGCLSLEAAALSLPNATHIFSIPLLCPPLLSSLDQAAASLSQLCRTRVRSVRSVRRRQLIGVDTVKNQDEREGGWEGDTTEGSTGREASKGFQCPSVDVLVRRRMGLGRSCASILPPSPKGK